MFDMSKLQVASSLASHTCRHHHKSQEESYLLLNGLTLTATVTALFSILKESCESSVPWQVDSATDGVSADALDFKAPLRLEHLDLVACVVRGVLLGILLWLDVGCLLNGLDVPGLPNVEVTCEDVMCLSKLADLDGAVLLARRSKTSFFALIFPNCVVLVGVETVVVWSSVFEIVVLAVKSTDCFCVNLGFRSLTCADMFVRLANASFAGVLNTFSRTLPVRNTFEARGVRLFGSKRILECRGSVTVTPGPRTLAFGRVEIGVLSIDPVLVLRFRVSLFWGTWSKFSVFDVSENSLFVVSLFSVFLLWRVSLVLESFSFVGYEIM